MNSKVSDISDVFHYTPDLVLNQHKWANFFSYLLSFDLNDIPPPPLISCGPAVVGEIQKTNSSLYQRFDKQYLTTEYLSSNSTLIILPFSLLNLTNSSREQACNQSLKKNEQKIIKLVGSLMRASQHFFYRKSIVLERIVQSKMLKTYRNRPELCKLFQIDLSMNLGYDRINDTIKKIGQRSFIFDSLPGISRQTGFTTPEQVQRLCLRLIDLEPLSLWSQPFDMDNSIEQILISSLKSQLQQEHLEFQKAEEEISNQQQKTSDFSQYLTDQFTALLHISLQSGDFKRVIKVTNLLLYFHNLNPYLAQQLRISLSFILRNKLNTLLQICNDCPSFHFLQHGSLIGHFKLAKNTVISPFSSCIPSITTDSSFIYLYLSENSKPTIYKIGTGQNGTVPGEFYKTNFLPLTVSNYNHAIGAGSYSQNNSVNSINTNCMIRWAYYNQKLYIRRAIDDPGIIQIFSSRSLHPKSYFKLHFDIFQQYPSSAQLNSLFPVITDLDGNMYAVVFFIKEVQQELKQDKEEEYMDLIRWHQKDMQIKRRKQETQREAAKKADEKAKQQAAKAANQKKKNKKQNYPKAVQPQASQLKKQSTSSQGEINLNNLNTKTCVVQFRVYQFDLNKLKSRSKSSKNKNDNNYLKGLINQDEVNQLQESFNDYFSAAQCRHALDISSNIQEAANWLLKFGERQRHCQTLLPKTFTTISEIQIERTKFTQLLLMNEASSIIKKHQAATQSKPQQQQQQQQQQHQQLQQQGKFIDPMSYYSTLTQNFSNSKQQDIQVNGAEKRSYYQFSQQKYGSGQPLAPYQPSKDQLKVSSQISLLKEIKCKDILDEVTGLHKAPPIEPIHIVQGNWSVERDQITLHLTDKNPWQARVFRIKKQGGVQSQEEQSPHLTLKGVHLPSFTHAKSTQTSISKTLQKRKDQEISLSDSYKKATKIVTGQLADLQLLIEGQSTQAVFAQKIQEKKKMIHKKVRQAVRNKKLKEQEQSLNRQEEKKNRAGLNDNKPGVDKSNSPSPPPQPKGMQLLEKSRLYIFQPLHLTSTYVETLQSDQINQGTSTGSLITYDPKLKKFYAFQISSSNQIPYFSAFQQLSNCKKVIHQMLPDKFKVKSIESSGGSMQEFVLDIRKIVLQFQASRYNLPWKWNSWSYNYQTCLDYAQQAMKSLENQKYELDKMPKKMYFYQKRLKMDSESTNEEKKIIKDLEEARKKFARLLTRFQNALKFQQNKAKNRHRIPERLTGIAKIVDEYKERLNKSKKSQKEDVVLVEKKSKSHQQVNKKNKKLKEIEYVLPQEEIILKHERKKEYPLCINGDLQTLQLLVGELQVYGYLIKDQFFMERKINSHSAVQPQSYSQNVQMYRNFYQMTLYFLLIWAKESQTYVRQNDYDNQAKQLFKLLQKFLVHKVRNQRGETPRSVSDICFKILLNGWYTIVNSLEEQSQVFEMIISQENNNKIQQSLQQIKQEPTSFKIQWKSQMCWSYGKIMIPNQKASYLQQFATNFYLNHHIYYQKSPFSPHILELRTILVDQNQIKGKKKGKAKKPSIENATAIKYVNLKQLNDKDLALNYYLPPYPYISNLLIKDSKAIQNSILRRKNVKRIAELYSLNSQIPIPSAPKNFLSFGIQPTSYEKQLFQNIKKGRRNHKINSQSIWREYYLILKQSLTDCISQNGLDLESQIQLSSKIYYQWRVFRKLLEQAFACCDWIDPSSFSFLPKMLNFFDQLYGQAKVLMKNKYQERHHHAKKDIRFERILKHFMKRSPNCLPVWVRQFSQCLQNISSLLLLTFPTSSDYKVALSISKTLGSLILQTKQLFLSLLTITNQTHIWNKLNSNYSDGVDFSNFKVFQTPHPYIRGDNSNSQSFVFQGAIAIQVQVDYRSRTEQNTDFLQIQSGAEAIKAIKDHNLSLAIQAAGGPSPLALTLGWNTFFQQNLLHYVKIKGRPALKHPLIFIGNKISFDFVADANDPSLAAKKSQIGIPGTMFAAPGSLGGLEAGGAPAGASGQGSKKNAAANEEILRKWGFRCVCRPIYSEDVNLVNFKSQANIAKLMISKDKRQLLTQKLLSKVSKQIQPGVINLHTYQKSIQFMSYIQSQMAKILLRSESFNKKSHQNKYVLKWHLFKGGLLNGKTPQACYKSFVDEIQSMDNKTQELAKIKGNKNGMILLNENDNQSEQDIIVDKKKEKEEEEEDEKVQALDNENAIQDIDQDDGDDDDDIDQADSQDIDQDNQIHGKKMQDKKQSQNMPEEKNKKITLLQKVQRIKSYFKKQTIKNLPPTLAKQILISLSDLESDLNPNCKNSESPEKKFISVNPQKIVQYIRGLQNYPITLTMQKKRPIFNKQMQNLWKSTQQISILAMLHHGNLFDQIIPLIEKSTSLKPAQPETTYQKQLKEQLKIIGRQANSILSSMLESVKAHREYQSLINDVLDSAKSSIENFRKNKYEQKKKKGLELMWIQERKKQKQLQEEKKEKQFLGRFMKSKPNNAPNRNKKTGIRNFSKKGGGSSTNSATDKKESIKGQNLGRAQSISSQQSKESLSLQALKRAKQDEFQQSQQSQWNKLTIKEVNQLKKDVYNKVYNQFLSVYQGNEQRCKLLCSSTNINYQSEDPSQSLKKVFKKVKKTILPLINFKEKRIKPQRVAELSNLKKKSQASKKFSLSKKIQSSVKSKEEKKQVVENEDESKQKEEQQIIQVLLNKYNNKYDESMRVDAMEQRSLLILKDIYEIPSLRILKNGIFLFEIKVSVDYQKQLIQETDKYLKRELIRKRDKDLEVTKEVPPFQSKIDQQQKEQDLEDDEQDEQPLEMLPMTRTTTAGPPQSYHHHHHQQPNLNKIQQNLQSAGKKGQKESNQILKENMKSKENEKQVAQENQNDEYDDDQLLPPIPMTRSMSAQVPGPKSAANNASKLTKWIENHKIWKNWRSQRQKSKQSKIDPTSPHTSPIQSVSLFLRSSYSSKSIRQQINRQQKKSVLRDQGLRVAQNLLENSICSNENQLPQISKFAFGIVSDSLLKEVFTDIEACGASSSLKINSSANNLLYNLLLCLCNKSLSFVYKLAQIQNKYKQMVTHINEKQSSTKSAQNNKLIQNPQKINFIHQTMTNSLQQNNTSHTTRQLKQTMKQLIIGFTDIKVLLKNDLTRQYLLLLIQNKLRDVKNSKFSFGQTLMKQSEEQEAFIDKIIKKSDKGELIPLDKIKGKDMLTILPRFCESLVLLIMYVKRANSMLNFSSSAINLSSHLENACKIILYQLIEPVKYVNLVSIQNSSSVLGGGGGVVRDSNNVDQLLPSRVIRADLIIQQIILRQVFQALRMTCNYPTQEQSEFKSIEKEQICIRNLNKPSCQIQVIHILSFLNDIVIKIGNVGFSQLAVKRQSSRMLRKCAQILVFILLHGHTPSVIRAASKACEFIFPHIDPRNLVPLQTLDLHLNNDKQQKNSQQDSALRLIAKRLGQWISLCPSSNGLFKTTIEQKQQSKEESKKQSANQSYFVYLQLNYTKDENLTYILNVLWQWQQRYPTFTKEQPQTVQKFIQEQAQSFQKYAINQADMKMTPLRLFKKNNLPQSVKKQSITKILKNLPAYKVNLCNEVQMIEKYFLEFVNLTWEDYSFSQRQLQKMQPEKFRKKKVDSKKQTTKIQINQKVKLSLSDGQSQDSKPLSKPIPDSPGTLLRKLKEQNMNIRIFHHISQAQRIISSLRQRGFAAFTLEPMSHQKAMELVSILQKPDKLPKIARNPFTTVLKDAKTNEEKKFSNGKKISELFPLTLGQIQAVAGTNSKVSLVVSQKVDLAKHYNTISIWNEKMVQMIECEVDLGGKIMQGRIRQNLSMQTLDANLGEMFNPRNQISGQKTGVARSQGISIIIRLLRSLIKPYGYIQKQYQQDIQHLHKQDASEYNNSIDGRSSQKHATSSKRQIDSLLGGKKLDYMSADLQSQMSLRNAQYTHQRTNSIRKKWSASLKSILVQSLKYMANDNGQWNKIKESKLLQILGVLSIVSGWLQVPRPGSLIKINKNTFNTLIDDQDGNGQEKTNQDTDQDQGSSNSKLEQKGIFTLLQGQPGRSGFSNVVIHQVEESQLKKPPNFQQIKNQYKCNQIQCIDISKAILSEITLEVQIETLICKAVLSIYKFRRSGWKSQLSLSTFDSEEDFNSKKVFNQNIIEILKKDKYYANNLKIIEQCNSLFMNADIFLMLLLRILQNVVSFDFRKVQAKIRNQMANLFRQIQKEEIYQNPFSQFQEQEMTLTALINWEQLHDKVYPFILNFQTPPNMHRGSQSMLKASPSKKQQKSLASPKSAIATELFKKNANSRISIDQSLFVLPKSGYTQMLPQPFRAGDRTQSALRLLNHWERSIIPKIVDYVKSSFRPWQMEYYFEQLRAPLRQGDQKQALKGALIICEKKIPAGCVVMPQNYDWGSNSPEECIPGQWVIAKFPFKLPKKGSVSSLSDEFDQLTTYANLSNNRHPMLLKWLQQGISKVPVLIRAFNFKTNEAFCEIYDHQNMRVFLQWIPVCRLFNPQCELPKYAPNQSINMLLAQTLLGLRGIQSLSSRKLQAEFNRVQMEVKSGQNRNIQRDELANYLKSCILASLNQKNKIIGWADEFPDCLFFNKSKQINADSESQKQEQNQKQVQSLRTWVNDNIQKILNPNAGGGKNQPKLRQVKAQKSSSSSSLKQTNLLSEIKQILYSFALPVSQNQNFEPSKNIDKLYDIHKWLCSQVWPALKPQFQQSHTNLVKAFNNYQQIKQKSNREEAQSIFQQTYPITHHQKYLLPLHQLLPYEIQKSGGKEQQELQIGIIITFQKSARLSPNSKVKFYSDPAGMHILKQIHATKEELILQPLVFSTGKIWCLFQPGSTVLLPIHQQESVPVSSLQCKLTAVPSNWPVAGWLTEQISNAILSAALASYKTGTKDERRLQVSPNKMNRLNSPYITIAGAKKLLGFLVGALAQFFSSTNAAPPIKQVLFKLLNRIIRKRRFLEKLEQNSLIQAQDESPNNSFKAKSFSQKQKYQLISQHYKSLSLESAWVGKLIDQIHSLFMEKSTIVGTLMSSYIQEAIQLFTSILMPLSSSSSYSHYKILTPQQLLNIQIKHSIQDYQWMTAVVSVGMFLHYFLGESQLPLEFQQELLNDLKLSSSREWQKVLMIQNISKQLSADDVKQKIWKIVEKNKARVIDKNNSIYIPKPPERNLQKQQEIAKKQSKSHQTQKKKTEIIEPDHIGVAIILLDGWQPICSTKDQEEQDEQENKEQQKVQEAKASQPPPPAIDIATLPWFCSACTFQNPSTNTHCDVCGAQKGNSSHMLQEQQPPAPVQDEQNKKESSSPSKSFLPDTRFSQIQKIEAQLSNQNAKRMRRLIKDIENMGQKEKQNKKIQKSTNKQQPEKNQQVQAQDLQALFDESQQPQIKQPKPNKAQPEQEKIQNPSIKVLQQQSIRDSKNFNQFAKFFSSRIFQKFSKNQVVLSQRSDQILRQIYDEQYIHYNWVHLPEKNQILESMELKDLLGYQNSNKNKKLTFQQFKDHVTQLGTNDPLCFWEIFLLHGYDFYLNRSGFSNILQLPKKSSLSIYGLAELRQLCQGQICQQTKAIYSFKPDCLRLLSKTKKYIRTSEEGDQQDEKDMQHIDTINTYQDGFLHVTSPELQKSSIMDLKFSLALLRLFNNNFSIAINFINPSTSANSSTLSSSKHAIPMSLASFLSSCRSICFMNIKVEMQQTIIEKTANEYEKGPKLEFQRLKLAHAIQKQQKQQQKLGIEINNKSSKSVLYSGISQAPSALFLQAFEQIRYMDLSLLRPKRVKGTRPIAFDIVFKGQHVQGEGGPYRQFFADISAQLQTSSQQEEQSQQGQQSEQQLMKKSKVQLDLLIPSPNNRAKIGDYKHKYVINPKRCESRDLELYQFLGILMGACIRTGVHLTLDLPSLLYKTIVGQPVLLSDLQQIDLGFTNKLQFLFTASQQQFREQIFQTTSINLSDDSLIELKLSSGSMLEYQERFEFIEKALNARINQGSRQISAIRNGIAKLVPLSLLSLSTGHQLEVLVCGKRKVDLQLLQRHTVYAGGLNSQSPRVKYFWDVMKQLTDNDQLKFIKFCWGQERLPANDEEFERLHTRFMIKPQSGPNAQKNPDQCLPKADTCFFNLELSKYSSKEILRERLLLAINTDCDSMNAEVSQHNDVAAAPVRGGGGGGALEDY